MARQTLAIVGAGIAGLGCAHFLQKRYDTTVYEQNDYAGGHTNTITVDEDGRAIPIDTGFMVYNEVTYPNLTRLFRELEVETKEAPMSFSVQHIPSGVEYNGGSLNLLFGQRRNLVRPRFWRMLAKISRFNSEAVQALDDSRFASMTLQDYVRERGYGDDFLRIYLLPMSSAVWSAPPDRMLAFPAAVLLRFWHNHGFLGLHTQHQWRTVSHGARSYVKRITEPFQDRVRRGYQVVQVTRNEVGAMVTTSDGEKARYDKVILACHGDQALALLADPTETEARLLGEFHCQRNIATLHTDPKFMPRTKRCWASWNYRIADDKSGPQPPTVHYWMNSLQGVSDQRDYFVSLNSHDEVDPEKVLRRIEYEHPLFTIGSIAAQKELPTLNLISSEQTTYYAGAWFKYGFHEDGFTSALDCARAVTGEKIWG